MILHEKPSKRLCYSSTAIFAVAVIKISLAMTSSSYAYLVTFTIVLTMQSFEANSDAGKNFIRVRAINLLINYY